MKTRIVFPYLGIGTRPSHPVDCVFCGDALASQLSPQHEYLRWADLQPDRDAIEVIEDRQERIRRSMV